MKAVVYNGARDVAVENIDDSRIEQPTDAIVRITTTNICGSDLHMYEGRTDFEQGRVFGHENLGEVVEVGDAVQRLKVGDWVCLPFSVACGFCVNCILGLTNYCLTARQPAVRSRESASETVGRLAPTSRPSVSWVMGSDTTMPSGRTWPQRRAACASGVPPLWWTLDRWAIWSGSKDRCSCHQRRRIRRSSVVRRCGCSGRAAVRCRSLRRSSVSRSSRSGTGLVRPMPMRARLRD